MLRPTRCRTRLFGDVDGRPVFVAKSGRTSFTVHEAPPVDPALERLGREGGRFFHECVQAGLATVGGSTGDPGLDRLVKEGGGRIISIDADPELEAFARDGGAALIKISRQTPLPPPIGRLSWRRGRRCGPYLEGVIATRAVLAFREPDGSWSVHRRGDTRIVVERRPKVADDGGPGSAVISDAICNHSAPIYENGEVVSGTPWPPQPCRDPEIPSDEELRAALPGAAVVELRTPAALSRPLPAEV